MNSLLFLLVLINGTVKFRGGKMSYDPRREEVILTDSAEIKSGRVTLIADSMIYRKEQKELLAYGSALLIIEHDTLRAESLIYHTENGKGVAFQGRTHTEKGYLTGKYIYRVSEEVLLVEDGTFTTCDKVPPHYCFYSPRMKIFKNEEAVVSPIFLKIRKIPILWAPFWFFPLKKGRKSGFLTPRIGYNSLDGKYLRNISYYLVLSNYADITWGLDIIEKRGVRGYGNLVYKRYRSFSGAFTFTLAQEFSPIRRRWSLFGSHYQTLPWGFTLRARSNLLSDVSYMEDYSEEKEEWIKSSLHSYISLTRRWSTGTFLASIDEERDVRENTVERTLPDITFKMFTFSLGPVRTGGSSHFLRKETEEETRYYLDNRASLNSEFSLLRYLKLRPELDLQTTLFDRDALGRRNVLRNVYSASLSLSTAFYGMSLFGLGPFERFRSTTRPSISFKYTPEIDQENLIPFGEISVVPPQKSGILSLATSIEGKTRKGKKLTLLTVNLSESYNFLNEERPFSSISWSSRLLPEFPVRSRISGAYDIEERRFYNIDFVTEAELKLSVLEDTSTGKKSGWRIKLTHSMSSLETGEGDQRLRGSLSGHPTSKWEMRLSFNFDLKKGELIDERIELERDLHCWAFNFRWSRYGDTWNYDFKLWIKKLPDVKFKRSLFEIFLPG